jgi:predicted kinase
MRQLWVMTGAPGCGKSTWLEKHNLTQYALSADTLRLLHQSPILLPNGNIEITKDNDGRVWPTIFTLLERRMERGDFTIIDATHSWTEDFSKYRKLAGKYRYRTFVINLRDVPKEVCLDQNSKRMDYRRVRSEVIEDMYKNFTCDAGKIPNSFIEINKENPHQHLKYNLTDHTNKYNNIYVLGDIHGCYTALSDFFKAHPLVDENLYIFTGDYIDRGIENFQTLQFLTGIVDKENVVFLEGNHEKWINYYANDQISEIRSTIFKSDTMRELILLDKTVLREFYRKMHQCAYFSFHGSTYFVSHGGIPFIDEDNLITLSSEQLIKGVGRYEDSVEVATTFENHYRNTNTFQIYGHRNIEQLPIQVNSRVFNLEGKVEYGGHLRCLKITSVSNECIEIKNNIFKAEDAQLSSLSKNAIREVVNNLRASKGIQEHKFKNISSFNFTRETFNNSDWNEKTITARGLFINTLLSSIVIRSYPKFFNIGESKNSLPMLQSILTYPATAYVKENGYIGLVGYDSESNQIICSSKASLEGTFADNFRMMFMHHTADFEKEIYDYVKNENVSLIFEVIDTVNDPHIIEYKESTLVLLDVIKRDLSNTKLSYEELCKVSNRFGFRRKTKAKVFQNWDEVYNWIQEQEKSWYPCEGYVLEDLKGYMGKIKLPYYKFWKFMRSCKERIQRNNEKNIKTPLLTTPLHTQVITYMINRRWEEELANKSIIQVRKDFYAFQNQIRT